MRDSLLNSGNNRRLGAGLAITMALILGSSIFVGIKLDLAVLVLLLLAFFIYAARRNTSTALAIWLVAVVGVPAWESFELGHISFFPSEVLSLAIVLGRFSKRRNRLLTGDGIVIGLCFVSVLGDLFGVIPSYIEHQTLLEWGLC